jgi:type IV fimbrial biogenesis protein FimT
LSVLIDRLSDTRERRKPAQYIARMETRTSGKDLAATQAGFTLYELMITLIIVSVVLSFGMANLSDFTKNGRMTSTANDLHAAFHLARSESARGKTNITVCASADPMAAGADCDGTWDQGYIVFIDADGDLLRAGAAETILRRHNALETGVSLAVANGATYFGFASSGLGRGNVGGVPAVTQIVMCDQRGNITAAGGNSAARLFVATPLGRATILRDMTLIGNALTNMGQTCP